MIRLTLSLLFVLTSASSYYFALENLELSREFVESLFTQFGFVVNLPHYLIFLIIFLNNSVKSLFAILLGVLLIPPLFFVIANGLILGIVVGVKSVEIGLMKTLLLIVPHGIIEIPAMIISASYGIELGLTVLKKMRDENVKLSLVFQEKIGKFVRYLLPAFFIAALIETYVTPIVANLS